MANSAQRFGTVGHQQLWLITDKFGLKPIYYAENATRLIFASEIKAVLCDPNVSRRQNPRGLAQFFSLGHFWNNDTFYDAISRHSRGDGRQV